MRALRCIKCVTDVDKGDGTAIIGSLSHCSPVHSHHVTCTHARAAGQAGALAEMKARGRFGELFFVVDTCQGGTLFRPFRTGGVLAVGSRWVGLGAGELGWPIDRRLDPGDPPTQPKNNNDSAKGENSYAHQNDLELGVALVDRFTDATSDYVHLLADRVAPLRPATARVGGGGHHHEQQQMQPPQQLPRVRDYLDQVGVRGICMV